MSPLPRGLRLTAQEERVFTVLGDWTGRAGLSAAVRGKTPPKVIVSILRRKLAPHGLTIECNAHYSHDAGKKWRVTQIEQARAA